MLIFVVVMMTPLLSVTSGASPTGTECDYDLHVSAVCYHCGALDRDTFNLVHDNCCHDVQHYRLECEYMYTEDPKLGK